MKFAKKWIFDLDGTLTKPVHDFASLRRQLNLGDHEDILASVANAPSEVATEMRMVIAQWEREQARQAEPAAYVHEFLDSLISRGCELGILTRNLKSIAIDTLTQIECLRYFPAELIFDRNSCQPKPSPDGVRMCLARMTSRGDAVFVGDYLYDLQAGRGAGCYTILRAEACPVEWAGFTDLWVQEFDELHQKLNDDHDASSAL